MTRLLIIAYFLEMGVVLMVVPWSAFWERNFFAQSVPGLLPLIQNGFLKGAVSGLGLVNVAVGLTDLAALAFGRVPKPPPGQSPARLIP